MALSSSRSPYEGFWAASKREAAQTQAKQAGPLDAKKKTLAPPMAPHTEQEPTRTDIMTVLAKKTTKEVRNWFREQIEGLDDSSSD